MAILPFLMTSMDCFFELWLKILEFNVKLLNILFCVDVHFFAGEYYQTTAGVPYAGDASFFYTQMALEF